MFIGIPLALVVLSVAGIGYIVLRKLPYLQKLAPDSHQVGPSLFADFFPEFLALIKKVDLKKFKTSVLSEAEKLLRKIRLLVLAVERVSDNLIHGIRRVQRDRAVDEQENKELEIEKDTVVIHKESEVKLDMGVSDIHKKEKVAIPVDPQEEAKIEEKKRLEGLRAEEQRLIVEIAQSYKDYSLYGNLAEVYIKMENWQDAKESLQTALKLKPDDRDLAQKLSVVLQKILGK